MAYVVTENCIKCKFTDCVDVCPVDCFHEGPNFLVIDPEECIDCTLCVPECPAEAIFAEDDVPQSTARVHCAECRTVAGLAGHCRRREALPDADEWNNKPDKLQYLER
jgi:ferredoxin